jgi:alcohol dehydrogenase class IV
MRTYNFPTCIHSGPGARAELARVLTAQGVRRPLLVTDRDLAEREPVREVALVLDDVGMPYAMFSGIWGNPVVSQAEQGTEAVRSGEHDAIVAVGGGATLDVAKCMALMAHHPGALLDYEDGRVDARPVDQPIPFVVAIPTTAGTGSEVGRSAVVSEDDTHVKRIIFSPRLLPRVVLLDAELTLGLPASVTAATGMDALTHLVEAYLAKGSHPMCEGIALQGLRLVAEHLGAATAFARDRAGATEAHLAAREGMLEAAMMGAVAFQKGLGANHSCAHALSTVCDLHHGLANALVLPHVMRLNQEAVPERFAAMAHAVGSDDFVAWLGALCHDLGIPGSLRAAGVREEHLPRLLHFALADPCHALNPRPFGEAEFRHVFRSAL